MHQSPKPSANDDILRLKAALDVALTTLNAGSDAVKAKSTPSKASVPRYLPLAPSSTDNTGSALSSRQEVSTHREELSSQAAPLQEPVGRLGGAAEGFSGSSDADARVRELEQLMIKCGKNSFLCHGDPRFA